MHASFDQLIADGKAALRVGNGTRARQAFEAALEETESGEVLECLGQAAYLEFAFTDCVQLYERAYAGYRDEDDPAGAVRVARLLGYMNGAILGDGAVMSGWIARAQTLQSDVEGAESGWIALSRGSSSPIARRRTNGCGRPSTSRGASARPTSSSSRSPTLVRASCTATASKRGCRSSTRRWPLWPVVK